MGLGMNNNSRKLMRERSEEENYTRGARGWPGGKLRHFRHETATKGRQSHSQEGKTNVGQASSSHAGVKT